MLLGKELGQIQAIRGMFSRLAPRYDLGNRVLSLGQDQLWRRYAARLAQPAKPGLVLDVASGTGDLALAIARLGSQVIALDFCAEMVELGVIKANRSRWQGKIHFLLGDAVHLPFPNDTFDAITVGFGIRNIPDLPRCLSEMKRVLKTGGRLVILELSRPTRGLVAAVHGYYLRRWVPAAGRWLSGRSAAYHYLARSILQFSAMVDIQTCLEAAGWDRVRVFRLGLGAAMVHLAIR